MLGERLTLNHVAADFEIIARPNSSLTAKGRVYAVMIIAAFSLAVAIAFSLIGAWFVLPFAGLELVGIGYAFYFIHCHSQDYESIVIVGDEVSVEKKTTKLSVEWFLIVIGRKCFYALCLVAIKCCCSARTARK